MAISKTTREFLRSAASINGAQVLRSEVTPLRKEVRKAWGHRDETSPSRPDSVPIRMRAGANLSAGQYSGEVGPIYIEPKENPGNYDRELFLTLKEFEPTFSRSGDMASDFLSPAATVESLKQKCESAMKASLARGMPHGFEVGYNSFTINERMLGHGSPFE